MGWGAESSEQRETFCDPIALIQPIFFFWLGWRHDYLRAFQMIQGCSHDAAPEKQSEVSDQYWKR
jgi:hypothetical protein